MGAAHRGGGGRSSLKSASGTVSPSSDSTRSVSPVRSPPRTPPQLQPSAKKGGKKKGKKGGTDTPKLGKIAESAPSTYSVEPPKMRPLMVNP
mmetsp:Transcript_10822/g.28406  ORF Transcript_10822/g.28406 Transcript_10822/m.28406 type:complete len:92 (-) Transcript_10822:93-368(-)